MNDPLNLSSLHQFFEQQANIRPEKVAILSKDNSITYGDLEKKANQLARHLLKLGIRKGGRVGILLERSINTYLTILAILKAGATYVPIHSAFPLDRIEFIISNAEVNLLITATNFIDLYSMFSCPVFLVDREETQISKESPEAINLNEIGLTANDLCYIAYTSGTTGTPKGIAISHRAVCSYLQAAQQIYEIKHTDRIYQGFSIAFDASVEEIWLAFSTGATLIPGSKNTLQDGIEVEFLNEHQITVLSCVPTFLAILEPGIPSLRILILGGEVCRPELLQPWYRPGLRIFNTYGPTEATVIATYFECRPNQPVTIGRALPHCEVFILGEDLKLVEEGLEGELCIAGDNLARGYIKHPELDQIKFINHHELGNKRLYRTGDLAKMLPNGEIQFLGRIDDQIKLRGFRIELREIESLLFKFPGVKNVAVAVKELIPGDQSLVAYLILNNNIEFNIDKLKQLASKKLPFYMLPSLFEIVDSFPTFPSGKVDRHLLPAPRNVYIKSTTTNYQDPRNSTEKMIVEVLEELFKHKPISIQDDFFYDLNGHSLLAAKFISSLRKKQKFSFLSIRDLYENPTPEKLAEKIKKNKNCLLGREEDQRHKQSSSNQKNTWRYYLCGLGQFVGCYLGLAFSAWQFLAIFLFFTLVSTPILSITFFIKFTLFLLLLHPLLFTTVILAKWLLLGRVKPGSYPLWGLFYFRWWLVRQLSSLLPIRLLIGSPLMIWYCRLMGARIGRNCCIRTHLIDSFDQLTMGDHSTIGNEASVLGYVVEDGEIKIGFTKIGDDCYVGNNSVLSLNTTLHTNAKLEDLSLLSTGATIPEGQCYQGSPAVACMNIRDELNLKTKKSPTIFSEVCFGILHYLFVLIVYLRYVVAISPPIILVDYVNDLYGLGSALMVTPFCAIIFILLYCFMTVLVKKVIIGTFQVGQYQINSFTYLRKWLFERLISSSLETIGSLYGTAYVTPWLRGMGAKVGKRVEVSMPLYIAPDLLTIGDESFVADLVQIGVPCVYGGYITFHRTQLGHRTFVGNSSVLPAGSEVGNGSLIGCLSVPPQNNEARKINSSWIGSPALFLPRLEIFEGFSEQETYRPSLKLYLQRLAIDFFRIILPNTFILMTVIVEIFFAQSLLLSQFSLEAMIMLFPLIYGAILLSCSSVVIALKWLLMQRFQPVEKPSWSMYVFKNEFITGLYDFYLEDLSCLLVGTPFLPYVLRLLGAKVGKKVFVDTTGFTDFDLVTIGNYVAINKDATIQAHLFEDRIFKTGRIMIKDNCNIGIKSVVLYDTTQEENSTLANLSLLMKGETLPAHSCWKGIPAQLDTDGFSHIKEQLLP